MDDDEFVAVLARESSALVDAGGAAGPNRPVPGCPGWTASDLVWHLGEVQDFWGWVVRNRSVAPAEYVDPQPPDGPSAEARLAAIVAFTTERSSALAAALADADRGTVVWTWAGQQPVGWVSRRMAHEAAVHRIDAERCAGGDHRLDPELAADGIDEFLTYFAAHVAEDAPPLAATVHVHCTDTAGEWLVTVGPDGDYSVAREHAKGDVALRGAAHDLLMVLWRRAGLDAVEAHGDPAVAAAFVARTRTT